MKDYRYLLVDVFTENRLEGNALAVFPDGRGLDERTMQGIAREMNLSETTFVFPPSSAHGDAAVRIFTPQKEMAFAGHPTIGTAFVLWRDRSRNHPVSSLVLEERVGPIRVRIGEEANPLIWLRTPMIEFGRTFDGNGRDLCVRAIGLESDDMLDLAPQLLTAGNPTVFIAVRDEAAVDKAVLDAARFDKLKREIHEPFCVFVFTPRSGGAYSRMFAPDYGIPEDPATGSSTGPLAAFMMANELVSRRSQTRFVSEQGTKMGRRSLLHVLIHGEGGDDGIEVGGHVTPVAEGRLSI